jgi:hypothetical protein
LGEWEAMDAYRAVLTMTTVDELIGGAGRAGYYLRQAALETVIARRMLVGATIRIHRALLTGASVDEIAHVLGTGPAEVAECWRSWAEGPVLLNAHCGGLGLSQREYDRAVAAIGAASCGEDTGEHTGEHTGGGVGLLHLPGQGHANRFTTCLIAANDFGNR